jgi:hypothetical protein
LAARLANNILGSRLLRRASEAYPQLQNRSPTPKLNRNPFPLPRQFEDPTTSGLGATLGSGQVAHDIELK